MTEPSDIAEGENTERFSTVWVFFGITLAVSTALVYVIGNVLDNTDGTILAVLVPSTVAIVLTFRSKGRAGVRRLLRFRAQGPIPVRLLLVAAFAVPVLAFLAVLLGNVVTGDTYDIEMPSEGLVILLPLLIVALGEEFGWRGFALPRLQRRYSALMAALVVGGVHWIWHYPPSLIETGVPLDTPFWLFGIFVVAWSVLMTSLFNASQGAVGLPILFHFASNAAFVFLPLLPEHRGGELTTFSIFVALSLTASIAVVVAYGPTSLANQSRAI